MQSVGGKFDTELQKFTFVLKRYESADNLCTCVCYFSLWASLKNDTTE
ncbi:MAG TPA: hypothetical protein PLU67_04020 [Candidatus Kapabacteria bacterium]|nr:hypothetical protein [Candidatus Kapabacteria bacterium]HPP39348.1 hypothetical protein [Candidatus Kapabacteria bacterium]